MKDQTDEVSEAIIEFARDYKEELNEPSWLMRLNAFLEERGLPPRPVPGGYVSGDKKK